MKEVLQSVCRDLDITDVSEIPICLSKLKMVVKTVPRMERLIAQVSEYLFERESHLLLAHAHTDKQDQHHRKDSRFTIDDIPKVLSRYLVLMDSIRSNIISCRVTYAHTNNIFDGLHYNYAGGGREWKN